MNITELKPHVPRDPDYQLNVPSFWPALVQGGAILLVGLGLAALSTAAFSGIAASPLRLAWGSLCFTGVVASVVVAVIHFRYSTPILGYWTGSGPLRESTGSCRVQQRQDGTWGLRLSFIDTLDAETDFLESCSGEELESTPDISPQSSTDADPSLFFRLDEAKVAELTRIFDPEQTVSVRWMDLPDAVGGPLLLHMHKTNVAQDEDTETELLAA